MPGLSLRYQQGKINIPADLLSRRPDYDTTENQNVPQLNSLAASLDSGVALSEIKSAQEADDTLESYRVLAQKERNTEFKYKNGVLYRVLPDGRDVLVVPTPWQQRFMTLCHD